MRTMVRKSRDGRRTRHVTLDQAVRTALDEYQYKVVEAGPGKKHNKFV